MNRRTVGVAILLVWFAALGWLAKRELLPTSAAQLAEAALRVGPSGAFYSLTMGDRQIGFASSTVDTLPAEIRVQSMMVMDIPVRGVVHRATYRSDLRLSRALRLQGFEVEVEGDIGRFKALGEIVNDSTLLLQTVTGRDTTRQRLRIDPRVVLEAMLPLRLALSGDLAPGRTYSVRIFDPVLLTERDVTVRIMAESTLVVPDSAAFDSVAGRWAAARYDTLRAFLMEQEAGGVSVRAWFDEQGKVVQWKTPVGFTMERTAYEIAYENFRRRDTTAYAGVDVGSSDILESTAISAGADLEPENLSELKVRLLGVDLHNFDLSGGRQQLHGDTLIVRRETDSLMTPGYRALPNYDPHFSIYRRAEPFIQVDDVRIQAQARQIVGRERNPRRAAELLNQWVYRTLRKEITVSVPSATQVLESRRGDCNEHTVLYVALARSIGLPTRTAAGVVSVGGRFYYHAWPEVYLGDWVAVDPTLGQFPADASHLRFTIGGLARQVELVRLIGQLRLEVL
jgi:transglutaminase superfamily protein